MSDKLSAPVTETFDPHRFEGVVVACADPADLFSFTERGYDTRRIDDANLVVDVVPSPSNRYADEDAVYEAAERAGVKVFETREDHEAYGRAEEFKERAFLWDDTAPNSLLAKPGVAAELEKAGYDAFKGHIPITNYEVLVRAFWRSGTFEASPIYDPAAVRVPTP